ncbi:hypothetical protein MCSF7_01561 [Mycoplasmopsis columbina SF7]|uniref:Lipoprotein n=1 Tax=Mycoplasmopsis columbina SF7 TaxID=1037410 RepID=F9UKA1_9BACT|nr:hypothetical protein [Mycoplasmopsis columbina]EGV00106.1 hypothetical protein MCSF7_01561 [Mycoplasmopsis columbina SF7]
MKLKKFSKHFLFSAILSTTIISTSCTSSFYDLSKTLETQFVAQIRKYYNSYLFYYQELKDFLNVQNSNGALEYFKSNLNKATALTNFWNDRIVKNSLVNSLLIKSNEFKDLGYYKNGQFISLKDDFSFLLDQFDLSQNDNADNLAIQMNNFSRINTEIYDVILSDYKAFNSWYISRFLDEFNSNDLGKDWPLFKSQKKLAKESQEIFFDRLKSHENRFESEFKNKIFDATKTNIDYSKLGYINLGDGSFGHTHSAVNLWREWNSMIFTYFDNDELVVDKNNKIAQINYVIDTLDKYIKDNNITSDIYIIEINNPEAKLNVTNFLSLLKNEVTNNQIAPRQSKKYITNFESKLIEPMQNLMKVAKAIVLEINNFNN